MGSYASGHGSPGPEGDAAAVPSTGVAEELPEGVGGGGTVMGASSGRAETGRHGTSWADGEARERAGDEAREWAGGEAPSWARW
ncbi:hypothetical protein [Streptomyces sp. NPDC003483]